MTLHRWLVLGIVAAWIAWVLLPSSLFLGGTGIVPPPQTVEPYGIELHENLVYYHGPGYDPVEHRLDLYVPKGETDDPVVIFVHGGSWVSGDKNLYGYLGRLFAGRGYLTAIVNYRLAPQTKHPGQVTDLARAFAWVVQNISQYGGDPGTIFLVGHSAGGHLVALLATNGRFLQAEGLGIDRIRGVVGISGVYDINALPDFTSVFTADPTVRRDASPIAHVSAHEPPFLLLYARYDLLTLDTQAKDFSAALTAQGDHVKLEEIADRDHLTIIGLMGQPNDPTTAAIFGFLAQNGPVPTSPAKRG